MSDETWIVEREDEGERLDKFLAADVRLGSRSRSTAALERGKVFVNGIEATRESAAARLHAGDTVRVWMDRPGSRARRAPRPANTIDIVFEDDAVVVVNKPAGLLSVPFEGEDSPSAYTEIRDRSGSHGRWKPLVVHRIDRDTSGLVVFARDVHAQAALKLQFKQRRTERVYWAVLYGCPAPAAGIWRDRVVWDRKASIQKVTRPSDPAGSDAISEYRVLETFRGASLVEIRLQTGRRNQIRLQARLRGHTLVGEQRYVFGPGELRPIPFERQALHAYRLGFLHPVDKRPLTFEAPPPADFLALLERLRH